MTAALPQSSAATARTWLFVPGHKPELFIKAAASTADIVILDLEDAVSPDEKSAARDAVAAWLSSASRPWTVRVNAPGTPWHEADLEMLRSFDSPVVMVPKAEDPAFLADLFAGMPDGSTVIALVETALGVVNAVGLAQTPGVVRLALGTYDLAAELAIDPDDSRAMAAARNALVLASAVGRLSGPIDGVTGDVTDAALLRTDVLEAVALGFAGKLCIHPAQVEPAAEALTPAADEVAWAERVLAAAASGDSVLLVDGRMVDAPVIARAHRIVASTQAGRSTRD